MSFIARVENTDPIMVRCECDCCHIEYNMLWAYLPWKGPPHQGYDLKAETICDICTGLMQEVRAEDEKDKRREAVREWVKTHPPSPGSDAGQEAKET